jgi:hypothetical protein
MNAISDAWRWMLTDVRRLGVIDFKWLVVTFFVSSLVTAIVRGFTLRQLERRNRLLRLLMSIQAANDELRRRGSEVQIDTGEFEV